MTRPVSWILGLILSAGLPGQVQAQCSLSAPELRVCVKTPLLITLRCRNPAQTPLEWLAVDDRRAVWELTRPDGQKDTAYRSRYSLAPRRISVAPGQELSVTVPVTRWFALPDAGTHRLRFRVTDAAGSPQLETDEISFTAIPCDDAAVLALCRRFLHGRKTPPISAADLEAVAGFDSPAAIPCMEDALARNSTDSASILDSLARIQTAAAIEILVKYFNQGEGFIRLAAWQALHRVDRSNLRPELREKVDRVLKEKPVTLVH